jgi:hypothetical protein
MLTNQFNLLLALLLQLVLLLLCKYQLFCRAALLAGGCSTAALAPWTSVRAWARSWRSASQRSPRTSSQCDVRTIDAVLVAVHSWP